MEKALINKSLQKEAEKLQYSLRSTFFYRRRFFFKQLIEEINQLDASLYDWSSPLEFGISISSWKFIRAKNITPHHIFCHPDVINFKPHLIAYYRLVAVLSQKGIQRLAFDVTPFENRKRDSLSQEKASLLAKVINIHISAIIDADPHFSIDGLHFTGIMNFGTQVNGSWRNEIGIEGSRRVKELITSYLLDKGYVSRFSLKDGAELLPSTLPSSIDDVQRIDIINGYQVIFGAEPDVSIINPKNILEGAIEVKAGIDPAGALERYGAAKKSFDRALRENKSAVTIYLASCITEGVKKAMADDRLVRKEFNLTNIFVSHPAKEEFLEYIQWLMHL